MDKITICIPAYNEEEYIEECIQSVLNQTYKSFDLIVLDNASTDNTAKKILEFKDNRITYICNERNLGGPNNINKCIEICNNKYLLILKADDLIKETMLEECLDVFRQNQDLDIVSTEVKYFGSNNSIESPFIKMSRDIYYKEYEYIFQSRYLLLSNLIMKCDFLRKNNIKFEYEKLGSACDLYFWDYVALKKGNIYFLNKVLYLRRREGIRAEEYYRNTGESEISVFKVSNQLIGEAIKLNIPQKALNNLKIKLLVWQSDWLKIAISNRFYDNSKMLELYDEVLKNTWVRECANESYIKEYVKLVLYLKIASQLNETLSEINIEEKFIKYNTYYLKWMKILHKKNFNEISKFNKIGIYGAEFNGRLIKLYLNKNRVFIEKYLDRNTEDNQELDGIPKEYPSLTFVEGLDLIIISNENEFRYLDIYQYLREIGYENEIIYWKEIDQ